MRLKSLELTNVGPHRKQRIDFETGLIGIFGPNGSGKSALLSSIYAAITGDFSRLSDTKEGAVCQQAEAHELSQVVLVAEHSGVEFKITRTVAPTSRSKLEVAGEILTKAPEIKLRLEQTLGATRSMLDNYVFVEQWELLSLWSMPPGMRAETLSYLCGTQFITQRAKVVDNQYNIDSALLHVGLVDVDALRQELGSHEAAAQDAADEIVELSEGLLAKEVVAAFQTSIKQYEQAIEKEAYLDRELIKLDILTKSLPNLEQKLADAVADVELCRENSQALSDGLRALQQQRESYKQRSAAWETKKSCKSRLAVIAKELAVPPPTMEISRTLAEIAESLDDNRDKALADEAIVKQLANLTDVAACPTCGQPLADAIQRYAAAKQRLRPLLAERERLREVWTERETFDKALQKHERNRQTLTAEHGRLLHQLETLVDVTEPPVFDEAGFKSTEACYQGSRATLAAAMTRQVATARETERERALQQTTAEKIDELNLELAEPTLSAEECEDAKQLLEANQELSLELAGKKALVAEYRKLAAAKQTAIEDAERQRARSEQAQNWVPVLSRVREVMKALPPIVHQHALRRMEAGITDTLASFEAPFRVTTAEDLTYTCRFNNGTVVPAKSVSGGQKVVLSLAFRWTLNSLFADQIGMMALDEPTAGLDGRHVELLRPALLKLGASAKSRGYQVIIITHETGLKNCFDQVLELERAIA